VSLYAAAQNLHPSPWRYLAAVETFFVTLKKELVNCRTWPDRLGLQSAVFEDIKAFYNRRRRHSTLNMLAPVNYAQPRLSPLGG
jgi:transposase InsO family protein